jgi:hypothetical protein
MTTRMALFNMSQHCPFCTESVINKVLLSHKGFLRLQSSFYFSPTSTQSTDKAPYLLDRSIPLFLIQCLGLYSLFKRGNDRLVHTAKPCCSAAQP